MLSVPDLPNHPTLAGVDAERSSVHPMSSIRIADGSRISLMSLKQHAASPSGHEYPDEISNQIVWADGDLYEYALNQATTSALTIKEFDSLSVIDGHSPAFGRLNDDDCDDMIFHRVENAAAGLGWVYTVLLSEQCSNTPGGT